MKKWVSDKFVLEKYAYKYIFLTIVHITVVTAELKKTLYKIIYFIHFGNIYYQLSKIWIIIILPSFSPNAAYK